MSARLHGLSGQPVIVGGGLAGVMTALRLAPMPVVLLSKGPIGAEASSPWAQGGLAASLGDDDDPALHVADTLAAGDGLCEAAVAGRILRAAPSAIKDLIRLGCPFDLGPDGRPVLGLEAAHSRRRIVHADGDGTGREVMQALVAAVRRTPSVTVVEGVEARRIVVEDGAVAGLLAAGPGGPLVLSTDRVVIATGGVGGLFVDTTNPLGCFGQGLALAARAGAELADLEFIQFHPTALDTAARPMRLVSEAVRGEGAIIIDEGGRRFLAETPGAELAPRDVVARAIWRQIAAGHRVYLDARQRPGAGFARRFPAIAARCREVGIDPARQPIPVRPAAHYHMGGIAVDEQGRSSVAGLWACGEAASTGLHGANRLASNSLTEAVVCAAFVAESIAGTTAGRGRRAVANHAPPMSDPSAVRPIMARYLNVERCESGLRAAVDALWPLAMSPGAVSDPASVALMIAITAWRRRESRGGHCRADHPRPATIARRSRIRLDEALAAAAELASPAPARRSAGVI